MLSKALVEVPIKAKVECVRTQKNSQAYKKTSCAKQDFVCRSKETFFQLELSCSARSMFAFLTDFVRRRDFYKIKAGLDKTLAYHQEPH